MKLEFCITILEFGYQMDEWIRIMGGMAANVFDIFTDNEKYNEIEHLKGTKRKIIEFFRRRGKEPVVILKSNDTYDCEMVNEILLPEIKARFISNIFGIRGLGLNLSFKDRILSNIMIFKIFDFIKINKGKGKFFFRNNIVEFNEDNKK